ncbi:hypothetical protein [Frankia sp. CiP1_Cm_nod2]|uniref:hypothetical protein n=1 Tax=Frankia sp. CiP1_Cm_nod2 TaxID=2897161 RepID=UPI002023D8E7
MGSRAAGPAPTPAELADAINILGDLSALDGRVDRDQVAARAAVTVAVSPMARSPLVKNLAGEAGGLLAKAAEFAGMPPADRAARRRVLQAVFDGSQGPDRVTFAGLLREFDDLAAALPKVAVAVPPPAAPANDALFKAADRVADGFRRRLDAAAARPAPTHARTSPRTGR